jgi:predicted HicB family RNase H-like nuclease
MKNTLKYKSYTGIVEFSAEDGVFFGKLFGINDLVTFEGSSVRELEKAFHEAVDDYIETCGELGKSPERDFKGSFNIRINPQIHRMAALKAQTMHISLNEFVEQAIEKEVQFLPLKNSREKRTNAIKKIKTKGKAKTVSAVYSKKT